MGLDRIEMQPRVSLTNTMQIDGTIYLSVGSVAERVGVSRTTLWRWRHESKIPKGQRYRGRQVVFTEDEARAIHEYAHRLEPAVPNRTKPRNDSADNGRAE
jgi:predicted DNA-binding transcriptional regulator AlpA